MEEASGRCLAGIGPERFVLKLTLLLWWQVVDVAAQRELARQFRVVPAVGQELSGLVRELRPRLWLIEGAIGAGAAREAVGHALLISHLRLH
eukprot:10282892-Alexandrium_andersonii.AAC.1